MTRSRAVVLQIPVPKRVPGPTTVTAEHQPAWAGATGMIVGYHGKLSPGQIKQRLVLSQRQLGVYWDYAQLSVRPRPDQRAAGDRSLRGLTLFDTKTAHVETRRLLGQLWAHAAIKWLRERGETLDRLNGVDFEDPRQYIPAFPECAAQIFRALPDLDVLIGLLTSPITAELAWTAMTPVWKISELAEQAYMEHDGRNFALRMGSADGDYRDIVLPGKQLGPRRRRDRADFNDSNFFEATQTCPT